MRRDSARRRRCSPTRPRGSAPAIRARRSAPQRRPLLGGPVAARRLVREHRAPQATRRRGAASAMAPSGSSHGMYAIPIRRSGADEQKSASHWLYVLYPARTSAGRGPRKRRAHGGAEENLGIHAVDVLVLHARGRAPPAGADFVETAHAHGVFLGGRPAAAASAIIGRRCPSKTSKSPSSVRSTVGARSCNSAPNHMSASGSTCESADTARNAPSLMLARSARCAPGRSAPASLRAGIPGSRPLRS